MKVLIWVVCFFVNALVTTIVKDSGVILGAIPTVILYGVTIWLARNLCKKWDERQAAKTLDSPNIISPKVADTAENKILFCRKCGTELVENSHFCRKCGAEIVKE